MENYKLSTNTNGDVEYITRAGSDFVRSYMSEGKAKGLIASGKYEKSDKFDGFEIKTGKYYFAGTVEAESEKSADEPKPKYNNDKKKN